VQVDSIKPTLKAPGSKRLKLHCDILLSTSAVNFNLRRYNKYEEGGVRAVRKFPGAHHGQGLTLVHFSAQCKPFQSHLPVFPCLIDWGKVMHPTYPQK
jgi:hypothetical protein